MEFKPSKFKILMSIIISIIIGIYLFNKEIYFGNIDSSGLIYKILGFILRVIIASVLIYLISSLVEKKENESKVSRITGFILCIFVFLSITYSSLYLLSYHPTSAPELIKFLVSIFLTSRTYPNNYVILMIIVIISSIIMFLIRKLKYDFKQIVKSIIISLIITILIGIILIILSFFGSQPMCEMGSNCPSSAEVLIVEIFPIFIPIIFLIVLLIYLIIKIIKQIKQS